MNTNFLEKIIAHKRREVAEREQQTPLSALEHQARQAAPVRSLWENMTATPGFHLICEIKKASPSRGTIAAQVDVLARAREYQAGGASAISVLTDQRFFNGSAADLQAARAATELPILRKDFIISPYQVVESRAMGADLILLIAAALSRVEIQELTELAHKYGMDVLLELHHPEEVRKIPPVNEKLIIGVNNRNLRTFEVSLENSLRLKPHLPPSFPAISESGVSTAEACLQLFQAGFQGVLIGEALMTSPNPRQMIQNLKEATHGAHTA